MKVAICDDDIIDLSNVVSLINDYKLLNRDKPIIEYAVFHNAVDFITAMERGQQYDLALLDILMPFMTGMDVAKEIRRFNQDIKIIFLTSSPEFALESYSVSAYYYALKPFDGKKLNKLFDKLLSEMEYEKGTFILIKSKIGLTRVYINKLEFAEVIGRTILYHLADGSVIEAIGLMSELEKTLLSNPCFIKPHRSYVIIVEYIYTLGQKEIIMYSLTHVPMARTNCRAMKSAYMAYAFKGMNTFDNF